jgi:hypothetical protein
MTKTKTLREYIKLLTVAERRILASEIYISLNYMNRLVVETQPLASFRLAFSIQKSDFNANREDALSFTLADLAAHERALNKRQEAL